MIRIRRVVDAAVPTDAQAIASASALLQTRFPEARPGEFADLAVRLQNPYDDGFRTMLYVAETGPGRLRGCAVVSHDPRAGFFLLEWLATDANETGGVGGALYQRVCDDSAQLGCVGVFFECLPDLPEEVTEKAVLRANINRLRFYERMGARPIAGTAYRAPVKEGERGMPLLVFGPTPPDAVLGAEQARAAIRAILERKYDWYCPPEYVERVVASVHDPVELREPRYDFVARVLPRRVPTSERIVLVVHEGHGLHHVRERGYVEAPARVDAILAELEPSGLVVRRPAQTFGVEAITAIHDATYVDWLAKVCDVIKPGRRVYPYVFPVRNSAKMPDDLPTRAGYYCIDTFTPLHRELFGVAKAAVDCTLTAADAIQGGAKLAYSLVRPPGHHAETGLYGGFCYFNNAAIAAEHLIRGGARRIAILDVDYHHGNGQQQIFYRRSDVLTVSIHGDPAFAYPYFTGFAEEQGEGDGEGFNVNLTLPERVAGPAYRRMLERAVARVAEHSPDVVVVCLGLDTASGDPTGTWALREPDFWENGRRIAALKLPTLVVQEGGYGLRALGRNALAFLAGLHAG